MTVTIKNANKSINIIMKNKIWNILMMLVLILGTAILFSSCGKDDESDNNNGGNDSNVVSQTDLHPKALIGTWEYVTGDPKAMYDVYQATYNQNGTCIYTLTTYNNDQSQILGSSYGTWDADGQYITDYCDGEKNVTKYSVSGNKLSLYINGSSSPRIYTKK